jgi:hypothetical protein
MSNDTKKRDSLYKLLEEVEKQAPEIEKAGNEMVRSARLTKDIAATLRRVVGELPNDDFVPDEHWQRTQQGWEAVQKTIEPLKNFNSYVTNFTVTATGSTVNTISMVYEIQPIMPAFEPTILAAKTEFGHILDELPLMNDVISSMMRLGLMAYGSKRPAADLLTDAHNALECPQTVNATGALPVLISLRECIESVLAELIRRRPKQEPAAKSSEKIVSIGKHCGRDSLPADFFTRLGADCSDLLSRLSGKKQASMPRPQIRQEFNEGLVFLKAFLESIDEAKLRP